MWRSLTYRRLQTFWSKLTVRQEVIYTIWSSLRFLTRKELCLSELMFATLVPTQLLASLQASTKKCPSTTASTLFRKRAKRLLQSICANLLLLQSKLSSKTTKTRGRRTLWSTETVLVMHKEIKCLSTKYPNLKMLLRLFTWTKHWPTLRLLSLLWTNESLKGSLFQMAMVTCLTPLQAVLLTSIWCKVTVHKTHLISTWLLQQQTKAVSDQSTFMFRRTIHRFKRSISSTWHLPYVISTSTGQVQSKFRLHASMRTKSLNFSRISDKGSPTRTQLWW